MQLDDFLIGGSASLREALIKIEANHLGFILSTDRSGAVIGLATDGDIRRKLLEGVSLEEPVAAVINVEFVWAAVDAPRETLLKKLDSRVKFIPLLDKSRHLSGIVSRDDLPIQAEEPVYARARSPVRISFGGGGSDLTYYFTDQAGAVINSTISIYSHATLSLRDDKKIIIYSRDIGANFHAENLPSALDQQGPFGLIQSLLKTIRPDFGFELYLHSDFPMKSGLGGSSVVAAAVLGCFNQFRRDQWDLHEIAELAYQSERLYLGVAGDGKINMPPYSVGLILWNFGKIKTLSIHFEYT